MLNDIQITETEAIFLTLESGKCSDAFCTELIEHVNHTSFDMFCYLRWLLLRWVHIRDHKHQLPTKRFNEQTAERNHKWKRKGDWFCVNCGDLQFKHNVNCRMCGALKPF